MQTSTQNQPAKITKAEYEKLYEDVQDILTQNLIIARDLPISSLPCSAITWKNNKITAGSIFDSDPILITLNSSHWQTEIPDPSETDEQIQERAGILTYFLMPNICQIIENLSENNTTNS